MSFQNGLKNGVCVRLLYTCRGKSLICTLWHPSHSRCQMLPDLKREPEHILLLG